MKRRAIPGLVLALALPHRPVLAADWAERLKARSHVLLVRHAHAPGIGDPPGFVLGRCETQRVLDESGRRQAARIGQWLRAQGVSQARIFSSPWCRCRETAELMQLGPVAIEPALGSFFSEPQQAQAQNARLQAFVARTLAVAPDKPAGNQPTDPLVLVTHHVNIREFTGRDIGSGDMVLARVDARGRLLEHWLQPSP